MKILYVIILLSLNGVKFGFGQTKMIVEDEVWEAFTLQEFSTKISKVDDLPKDIQRRIKAIIAEVFWDLKDSIRFFGAQVIDVKSAVKHVNRPSILMSERKPLIPKYELSFSLQDTTIGIIRYYVLIHLDDYGQILDLNWPIGYGGSKRNLLDRRLIYEFASREVTKRGFSYDNYSVIFKYNEEYAQLFWTFNFFKNNNEEGGYTVTIPWSELKIIESSSEQ